MTNITYKNILLTIEGTRDDWKISNAQPPGHLTAEDCHNFARFADNDLDDIERLEIHDLILKEIQKISRCHRRHRDPSNPPDIHFTGDRS